MTGAHAPIASYPPARFPSPGLGDAGGNGARSRRNRMRRPITALVVVAVSACAGLTTGTAAADPLGICPDDMVPAHESSVPSGSHKDHNHNDLVCVKPVECLDP